VPEFSGKPKGRMMVKTTDVRFLIFNRFFSFHSFAAGAENIQGKTPSGTTPITV